jgi:hypothetical protein
LESRQEAFDCDHAKKKKKKKKKEKENKEKTHRSSVRKIDPQEGFILIRV